MTITTVSKGPGLTRAVTLALLTGCYAGPTLRYEEARPETATVLAGSLTAGAGYSVSEGASYEDAEGNSSTSDEDRDPEWYPLYPNAGFSAWWRWAHGERWELSTGTDVDLGYKCAVSAGFGAKLLLTPTDPSAEVHLGVSAALGGTALIFPGLNGFFWADLALPLTFEAGPETSVTLRPLLRYVTGLFPMGSGPHLLYSGGSLAVRHPCSETVVCVYELGVLAFVYPTRDDYSEEGFVSGLFGVGAVF